MRGVHCAHGLSQTQLSQTLTGRPSQFPACTQVGTCAAGHVTLLWMAGTLASLPRTSSFPPRP